MVGKGEMWIFDSSCITQPQSQIATDSGFIFNTLYLIYVNHFLTFYKYSI